MQHLVKLVEIVVLASAAKLAICCLVVPVLLTVHKHIMQMALGLAIDATECVRLVLVSINV